MHDGANLQQMDQIHCQLGSAATCAGLVIVRVKLCHFQTHISSTFRRVSTVCMYFFMQGRYCISRGFEGFLVHCPPPSQVCYLCVSPLWTCLPAFYAQLFQNTLDCEGQCSHYWERSKVPIWTLFFHLAVDVLFFLNMGWLNLSTDGNQTGFNNTAEGNINPLSPFLHFDVVWNQTWFYVRVNRHTYIKYLYFLKLQTVVPLYSWSTIVKLWREVVLIWCSISCKTHFQVCTFPTVYSSRNVSTEHVTDNLMLKSILLLQIICTHAKDQWLLSPLLSFLSTSISPPVYLHPPTVVSLLLLWSPVRIFFLLSSVRQENSHLGSRRQQFPPWERKICAHVCAHTHT